MRKHGGLFFVALLLLLAPSLASAWTLYVKVQGNSSDGTVTITDEVKSVTLKGGQSYVQLTGAATANVVLDPNIAADVTIDYVTTQQAATTASPYVLTGKESLIVAWGQAASAKGNVTVAKTGGGSTLLQYNGGSTMTGYKGLAFDTIVGVKANPRSDYQVSSIVVSKLAAGETVPVVTNPAFTPAGAGQPVTVGVTVDVASVSVSATYELVANAKAVLSAPLKAVVGQSVTLSANGTTSNDDVTYQFVVAGFPVQDSTSKTYTFTPTTDGNQSVILNVLDDSQNVLASKTATINVVTEAAAYNNLCLGCHTGSTPKVIEAYNAGTLAGTTSCAACHTSAPHNVGPYAHEVVKNTAGRDVAAGSDVCLRCHTAQADWADTPHTQKAQMGKEYVVGYNADPALYTEAAKWITENRETYIHPSNKNADGTAKDATKVGVRAVMTEKPTVTFSAQTFGVEDITIVIGSNHKQAYAVWMEGYGNKVLNIRYNGLDPGLTRSMGDRVDERVWEGSCIGCHSTTSAAITNLPADYADSATPFDLNPSIVDLRVGCEACHGPVTETGTGAGIHNGTDGTGHALNPADLTQDQQIDICGRCHGNWNSTVAGTTARKDVAEFKAGDSLVYLLSPGYNGGVDRIRRPVWGTSTSSKPFLGSGASNDDHQQWYDFKIGNHYGASVGGVPVTCTSCHDPHKKSDEAGRIYGRIILKGSYDLTSGTSTVCATCHEGDSFVVDGKTVTKKGKTGALNPHTGKAYGVGVEPLPAPGAPWPWE